MNRKIKYIIIDVDGTMTDGSIYYDENGNELKKFCTKDAAGFFAAHKVGIKIVVLTGRECGATTKRMRELNVDYLFQNIKNKSIFLSNFMEKHCINREELGYIGDDLNDFLPMHLAGFIGCPADSCQEIIEIADYVGKNNGGHGAVREIIEHMLRMSDEWTKAISEVYSFGI